MLKSLLQVRTMDDVAEFGPKLLSSGADCKLFDEIISKGILLDSDDLFTVEDLEYSLSTDAGSDKLMASIENEDNSERIVHLLQIIAHCHEGVSAPIDSFLKRACL